MDNLDICQMASQYKLFITDEQIEYCEKCNIYTAQSRFEVNNFNIRLFTLYGIKLPKSIENSSKNRQAEFLAGRVAAKKLLKKIGSNITHVPIGQNRAPIWPKWINGSISHTNNIAFCAVSKTLKNDFLGVDIEKIIDSTTAAKIKPSIINYSEEIILLQMGMPLEEYLTIAFSAKESLFKAIHPYIHKYMDFNSSEVIEIDVLHQLVKLKLCVESLPLLKNNSFFTCTFQFQTGHVRTLITGQF